MEKELGEVWRCAVCAEGACPDAAASLSDGVPPVLRVPAPAPCRRRRLRRFGTRSATAPSLIFLAPRRSVFISMNSLHWRLGLLLLLLPQWKKNWMRCLVVAAC